MLRNGLDHGFPPEKWNRAKTEARDVLVARARHRLTISYSELVAGIRSIALQPRDPRLFHFLGEISTEEDAAGRGMLTVVVVHKSGDLSPGEGFFELATSLGRTIKSHDAFWIEELNRVFDYWSKSSGKGS